MATKSTFYALLLVIAVASTVVAITLGGGPRSAAKTDLEERFQAEYQAYLGAPPPDPAWAWNYSSEQLRHLQAMAQMGPGVLPYLIGEARRTHDMNLTLAIGSVSRLSLRHAGWPGTEDIDSRKELEFFIQWWDAGQERTDQMFAEAYAAGDTLKMASLGIAALPRAMEKLEAGDDSMLEVVRKITKPLVKEDITADAPTCRAWWQANKADWIIPFPDRQATAP